LPGILPLLMALCAAPLPALEWTRTEAVLNGRLGEAFPPVEFPFTNKSAASVTITDIRASCHCTVPVLEKKTYAPGESGVLRVDFDTTGLAGSVTRAITVATDEPGAPAQTLTLIADLLEPIALKPRLLHWKLAAPAAAKTVDIQINRDDGLEITGATGSRDDFKVELATLEPRRRYRLTVTPAGTGDARLAVITLKTLETVPAGTALTVFAQVR
jgi:hypothetical protein